MNRLIKIKLLLLLLLTIHFHQSFSQTPTFSQALQFGGGGLDEVRGMATDGQGYIHIVGVFYGTAVVEDFFGSPLQVTAVGNQDMFYLVLFPDGLGSFQIGGLLTYGGPGANVSPTDIKINNATGSVYITGTFDNTVDFNPWQGTYNLTSNGGTDIFVLKTSGNGWPEWARQFGGSSSDGIHRPSVGFDSQNNVYSYGDFYQTVDFDPGTGVYNLSSGQSSANYLCKLNSGGQLVWVKQAPGVTSTGGIRPRDLEIDVNNNIVVSGFFSGITDFDPGPGTSTLTSLGTPPQYSWDIYTAKYDSAGQFNWARHIGGNGVEYPTALLTDAAGNVYLGGYFSGTIDLDPGPNVASKVSSGLDDAMMVKLDASGNHLWSASWGGLQNDHISDFSFDPAGNLYVTGDFLSPVIDMDPGAGVANLNTAGVNDAFLLRLDPSGNHLASLRFGGTQDDAGQMVEVMGTGEIFVAGYFYGTTDLDPGPLNEPRTAYGWIDCFISMFAPPACQSTIGSTSVTACGFMVSPGGNQIWNSSGIYTDTLINAAGCDSILTVNLTINNLPAAAITPAGPVVLCPGGNVVLQANTGTGLTYVWKKYGVIISGAVNDDYTAATTGKYKVVVTDQNGCSQGSNTVEVTISAPPTAVISALGNTSFCSGDSLVLLASSGPGYTYQWKKYAQLVPGGTQQSLTVKSAGKYRCIVTDANGCSKASNMIQVTVYPKPPAVITASGSTSICAGDSVLLSANSGTGFSYQWKKYAQLINGATAQNFYAKTAGNYKCIVTNANGCSKSSNGINVSITCRETSANPSGITEIEIFPNPSYSGTVTVSSTRSFNDQIDWAVTDLSGRVIPVVFREINDRQKEIQIEHTGVFLIVIPSEEGPIIRKLMIY